MGDKRTKYVVAGLVAVVVALFAYRSCEPVRRYVSSYFSEKNSARPLDGGTDRQSVGTAEPKAEGKRTEKKRDVKGSDSKRRSSGKTVDRRGRGPPFVKVGELDDGEWDIFRFKPRRGKGKEQASNRFDDWDDSQGNNYENTGSLNVVDVNGNPVRMLYRGRPGYIKARPIGVRPKLVGEGASGRIEYGQGDKVAAGDAEGSDGRERAEGSDKKGGDAEEGEGKGNEKETEPEDFEVKFIYRLPVREGDPLTDHYRKDITSFLQGCLDRGDRGEFMLRYAIDVRGNLLRAIPERVSGKDYPANCAKELSELVAVQKGVPSADGIFGTARIILGGR